MKTPLKVGAGETAALLESRFATLREELICTAAAATAAATARTAPTAPAPSAPVSEALSTEIRKTEAVHDRVADGS